MLNIWGTTNERLDLLTEHHDKTCGLPGVLKIKCGDMVSLRKNINYKCG